MQTQIIISDISIRQDSEGRYSINDLHKAAGAKEKDKPSNWLRSEKTIELINTILNAQIRAFNPVDSYKGRYGGTYVCKELVYAYATWISSEFFLKVISAYDALVSGDTEKAESIAKTTVDDRTPLRSLVNRIMGKYGMTYQAVYKLVHKEFGVKHIDELSPRQATEAMEYLAAKAIEGEFLGKQMELPVPALSLDYGMSFFDKYLWIIGRDSVRSPVRYPAGMLVPNGDYPNPCGRLLVELRNAGFRVEAAEFQLKSLQHHLEVHRHRLDRIHLAVINY